MLETYIAFYTDHWIAVVVFSTQLAIRPVVKYFDLRPDEQDLKPWVRWYRNLPKFFRAIVDGVLLTVTSLTAEWYIQSIAIPRLSNSVLSQLLALWWIAVGIGVGLSIGKALTETDYSWYKR